MTSFKIPAIIAGLACLGLFITGCAEGQPGGGTLAGCPDEVVEFLVVSDAGAIETQDGKFLQLVDRKDQKLVVVDFSAEWCGPCQMLSPHLDRIRKDWGDKLEVVKVDVDKSRGISGHFGIDGIPDVRIFRSGKQVGRFVGLQPRQEIEAMLKSLL